MKPIVIVGGGGHARVLASVLAKIGRFTVVGYTDPSDHGPLLGRPYLGTDEALAAIRRDHPGCGAAIGLGATGPGTARRRLADRIAAAGFELPPIVSPDAIVDPEVVPGAGAMVFDGAVVNCGAAIGRGAILNTGCIVEHDTRIGEFVHVGPGAVLSGGVTVGDDAFVGAGATVIHGVCIAPGSVVGAGATVVGDLLDPGVYAGCPARRIR